MCTTRPPLANIVSHPNHKHNSTTSMADKEGVRLVAEDDHSEPVGCMEEEGDEAVVVVSLKTQERFTIVEN